MQIQRRRILSYLLLTISLFHLRPLPAAAAVQLNNGDYIMKSCNTTSYADLCYASLSPYARSIQRNPARLARVSIAVCRTRFRQLAAYIAGLSRCADRRDSHLIEALSQCSDALNDAVGELEESLQQMRRFDSESDIESVETWMSAVMADTQACIDGFEETLSDGPEKSGVMNRMNEVSEYVSISLAFVAGLLSDDFD